MRLQAGLVAIGVGVSLGVPSTTQASILNEDDSLICAVYLMMAVDDLMPAGSMTTEQAKENMNRSYRRLTAMSLMHDIPASEIAQRYSDARKYERQNMTIDGQPASRLIYSDRSLEYTRLLAARTQQYCMHSEGDIKRVFNDMPLGASILRLRAIKFELQAIEEN